jgi:hypothetical protein
MHLAHNVFFKLHDAAGADALVAACKKYLTVQPGIVYFAAGKVCEDLDRPVNDRDWHVGLHVVFESRQHHDDYQNDPTHHVFINENKGTWAAVRVFDSYV